MNTIAITRATPEEYEAARRFYHSLIDAVQGALYHPMWRKDIYPTPEDLKNAAEGGRLYLGRVDGRIAAAMVINQNCNDEYRDVSWSTELEQGEFMVIHMLGVHSDFAGRGYAKELVRFAIDLAGDAGMKAIRLDVLKGNLPAEKLYSRMGFVYVDTVSMFYEDTGWREFELYEYSIDAGKRT